jgi:O-antigen/teichoic acid export membrane protein
LAFSFQHYLFGPIKIVSSILIQLATLSLTGVLTSIEFGKLALIISVSQFAFVFTNGWTNGLMTNLGMQSHSRGENFLKFFFYRLIILLITYFPIFLLANVFKEELSIFLGIQNALILVLKMHLALLIYDMSSSLLYVKSKYLIMSLIDLTYGIILFLGVKQNVSSIEDYIEILLRLNLFYSFLCMMIFFFKIPRKYYLMSWLGLKSSLEYSAWQGLSILSIYLVNLGGLVLLRYFDIPFEEIGSFNLAFRFYSVFSLVFAASGLLVPRLLVIHEQRLLIESEKFTVLLVVFLLAGYVSLGYLLPYIGSFLDVQIYDNSQLYFFYLACSFVPFCYITIWNQIFANTVFYKKAQLLFALQSISYIIITFISVPIIGVFGLILGLIISNIIAAFTVLYIKKGKYLVEIGDILL